MLEAAAGHLTAISHLCKMCDTRDQKFRNDTETKYFATNMFTVVQEMT